MTLLIPPGFGQLAFRMSLVGDPDEMVTTIGIEVSGTGVSEAAAAVGWFESQFGQSSMSAGWAFVGVSLRVGQDGGPPSIVDLDAGWASTSGTAGGLPTNCAYLVRKQTSLGGRTGRGRMFWPCFIGSEEEINQNGMLSGTAMGDLAPRFSSLESVFDLVLLHDSESPGPGTPTPIIALSLQPQIATQRRRMRS